MWQWENSLSSCSPSINYNANSQHTAFGVNAFAYDLEGKLATVTESENTATYTRNARNQLTGISTSGCSC